VNSRTLAAGLAAALTLAGCSTIGGWFGSDEGKIKPAELVEFKPTAQLEKAWEAQVGDGAPYALAPASDGQAVYAAGREGRVVKIDLLSGRELWRIETGAKLSAGVGVGADLVLVGTPKGVLLAYRAADGQAAWTAQLSGEIITPPVAGAGAVAVRSNNGNIWLLEAQDGKQRWVYSRTMPALTLREPAGLILTPMALYAGHPGGRLTALSLVNGAPVWEASVALPKGATELERIADVTGALALSEQTLCAAAYQGRVACFDADTGNASWGRDLSALRGVGMDHRFVYVADTEASVMAFERERGINPWKQDKLHERRLSTPLAIGRHVAVGDLQGYIHLLDSETGAFAARAATDGSPIVAPPLAIDRGLVAQTANGGVYAFKIGDK